jgi:hypothetical protein
VRLEEFVDRWQVRVDDEGGPRVPHVCLSRPIESLDDLDDFGDDLEAGRGLALVATVSSGWGVLGDQNARTVWAEILMPAKATAVNSLLDLQTVGASLMPSSLRTGKVDDAARR